MSENETNEIEHYHLLELDLYGDIDGEVAGDDPPVRQPQSITILAPKRDDHVAVIRTPSEVTHLAVFEWDESTSFDSDLKTVAEIDGVEKSEFWIDADSLYTAEVLYVDTEGQDLESIQIDVEYRGRKARIKKWFRELNQKIRVEL